jgi:hypothetical protein
MPRLVPWITIFNYHPVSICSLGIVNLVSQPNLTGLNHAACGFFIAALEVYDSCIDMICLPSENNGKLLINIA